MKHSYTVKISNPEDKEKTKRILGRMIFSIMEDSGLGIRETGMLLCEMLTIYLSVVFKNEKELEEFVEGVKRLSVIRFKLKHEEKT